MNRGDIYWVDLDPTIGSEIQKRRPALIVSTNDCNKVSSRVIVAPLTTSVSKLYRFEVKIELGDKESKILLDQIRSVDKVRLSKKIVSLDFETMKLVDQALKIVLALT